MNTKCSPQGRFSGRRIVVFGGGQQDYAIPDPPDGIGRSIVRRLAAEGARLAVADIDPAAADRTCRIVTGDGGNAVTLIGDLADDASTRDMVRLAAEQLGGLDGIVANVGVASGTGLQGTSSGEWDRVPAANLRGHFHACKHSLPRLANRGSILLIGSAAALAPSPHPAYGASKAALRNLVLTAAYEAAPRIRVNLLVPGLIDTPLGRLATQYDPARAQLPVPLQRHGHSREVAAAAAFLLSEDASYITGQELVVDGGLVSLRC